MTWRSYTVHVSQAYKRVGRTAALYTFNLVFILMPLLSHTDALRRPNVKLALEIRLSTSESMFTAVDTVMPMYEKSSTAFRVPPSTMMQGSDYGCCGLGADDQSEVPTGCSEPIHALLHFRFSGGVQRATIGEQEVVDQVFFNFCLRLKPGGIEEPSVCLVSVADARAKVVVECIR